MVSRRLDGRRGLLILKLRMLPEVPPTNKDVEVVMVSIVCVRGMPR